MSLRSITIRADGMQNMWSNPAFDDDYTESHLYCDEVERFRSWLWGELGSVRLSVNED